MECRFIDYKTEREIPKEYLLLHLREKAAINRINALSAIKYAKSGHTGGSLSPADIITALYSFMMPDDVFVLSKGHAVPILYAAFAAEGYIETEELKKLRIKDELPGHAEPIKKLRRHIRVPTGSLGQGLGMAGGIALGKRCKGSNARVYALLGDGECDEGSVWEAAMFANQHNFYNLTAIIDHNGLQLDGRNDEIIAIRPIREKFEAHGWDVIGHDMRHGEISLYSGHDFEIILDYFAEAHRSKKPTAIIFNTIKAKGISFMENKPESHGWVPKDEEYMEAMKELLRYLEEARSEYYALR